MGKWLGSWFTPSQVRNVQNVMQHNDDLRRYTILLLGLYANVSPAAKHEAAISAPFAMTVLDMDLSLLSTMSHEELEGIIAVKTADLQRRLGLIPPLTNT